LPFTFPILPLTYREMAYAEFHYRWEYELQSSPEDLWPLVADTNRFNRDTGLPSLEVEPGKEEQRLLNARRRLRLFKFGVPVVWEEQPFEWVRPFRFGVERRYLKGPVADMRVRVDMQPRPTGGTKLTYEVWATPRSALGRTAIPLQIGVLAARSFGSAIRRYDQFAAKGKAPLYQESRPNFSPGGRARLEALCGKLVSQGAQPEVVARLDALISQADDLTLARIRSHTLADYWGMPRRDFLEACLMATRIGLLDLQWDTICPHCRGASQTSRSLSGIRSDAYCETCNVDFAVNFDQAVELTFSPNAAIRQIEAHQFCVGGPQVTPHIVAQQLVAPGEKRSLTVPLEGGRYRLRAVELPGAQFLLVAQDAPTDEQTLRADSGGWSKEEVKVSTTPSLVLENATDREQLFILERVAWSDQAATAAEVTALQVFRDLFSNEALRPGEQISVGTLTMLFTDLRGSTQLYREIGDASAFGRVMSHFDVLREAIKEEDGALVKTIGDAVMAVFRRPAAALRAILKAQRILAAPPDGARPLMLKVGIHSGPCIAVTLNDRLDYFGGTVNLAARLEGLSTGGDVIVSPAVHADPEVTELLERADQNLVAEQFEMTLKGFDEERFDLWRIVPKYNSA
jgi:class 3 adenylate cyclase